MSIVVAISRTLELDEDDQKDKRLYAIRGIPGTRDIEEKSDDTEQRITILVWYVSAVLFVS